MTPHVLSRVTCRDLDTIWQPAAGHHRSSQSIMPASQWQPQSRPAVGRRRLPWFPLRSSNSGGLNFGCWLRRSKSQPAAEHLRSTKASSSRRVPFATAPAFNGNARGGLLARHYSATPPADPPLAWRSGSDGRKTHGRISPVHRVWPAPRVPVSPRRSLLPRACFRQPVRAA